MSVTLKCFLLGFALVGTLVSVTQLGRGAQISRIDRSDLQQTLDIEQARTRLKELLRQSDGIEQSYQEKFDREISKRNAEPKGEYETTKDYQSRLVAAEAEKRELKRMLESEMRARKGGVRHEINRILELEFRKPVKVSIGQYDADEEEFPLSIADLSTTRSYEDNLRVPQPEARDLKDHFSEALSIGLFALSLTADQDPEEYCYGVEVKYAGRSYTSVPMEGAPTQADLRRYYQSYGDPYVSYLRRVFVAYLRDTTQRDEEFELLSKYDDDYLRSKFIIYSYTPFLMGGRTIELVFQDRPDAVFSAWVYKQEGFPYRLRAFRDEEFSPKQMKRIRLVFKRFLDDKVHAL